MKTATLLALFVGLILFTGLVASQGVGTISSTLGAGGWALLWLGPVYVVPLSLAALSWHLLFPSQHRPSKAGTLWAAWIGMAVNWLLPVAQIGGELVKARVVTRQGVSGGLATASVVVDKTIQAVTIPIFAVVGLALFLVFHHGEGVVLASLGLVGLLGVGIYFFYRIQQAGLFGIGARLVHWLVPSEHKTMVAEGADRLDEAVGSIYDRRRPLLWACALGLSYRLALAGEIWLILHILGYPIQIADAIILESLTTVVIAAAFVVPGSLGVQEGGFMLLGAAIGIDPALALTLSLCKRVRELLVGVPGLVAWQVFEGRHLLRRPGTSAARDRGRQP